MKQEKKNSMSCADYMRLGLEAKEAQYKGGAMAESGNFIATARKYFTMAVRADNSCVKAYMELANCNLPEDPQGWELMIVREAVRTNPASAEARNRLGLTLWSDFCHREAIQELQVALSLDPQNSDAASNLGYILYEQKRWREAEEVLTKVPQLDVMGTQALTESLKAQNKTDELKKFYESRIKTSRDPGGYYFKLAEIFRAEGDFNKTVALAEEMGARSQNPLFKNLLLIDLHLAQGMNERALALCREAVKLRPGEYDTMHRLIKVLKACGDIEGSLEVFRELAKTDVHHRSEFAQELKSLGRMDEAIVEFRAVLADNPHDETSRASLSEILRGQGDSSEALALWEDYSKWKKDDVSMLGLANELKVQGQLGAAVENCLKVIKLARQYRKIYACLIPAWGVRDCLNDITKLLENSRGLPGIPVSGDKRLLSKLSKAHGTLSLLFQECRQFDDAADAFRKAASLFPKSIPAFCSLASALKSSVDLPGALKAYESALLLFPEGPIFNFSLFKSREKIAAEINTLRCEIGFNATLKTSPKPNCEKS